MPSSICCFSGTAATWAIFLGGRGDLVRGGSSSGPGEGQCSRGRWWWWCGAPEGGGGGGGGGGGIGMVMASHLLRGEVDEPPPGLDHGLAQLPGVARQRIKVQPGRAHVLPVELVGGDPNPVAVPLGGEVGAVRWGAAALGIMAMRRRGRVPRGAWR